MPRGEPLRLTPMFPRVTAILVVHRGGDHLRRTLAALDAQTRRPDALVAVLARGRRRRTRAGLRPRRPPTSSSCRSALSFGEAVRAGDRILDEPASDADALWLLAEDSAPAPDALAALVATLETAKSVAIAGPKLRGWAEPDRIARLRPHDDATGARRRARRRRARSGAARRPERRARPRPRCDPRAPRRLAGARRIRPGPPGRRRRPRPLGAGPPRRTPRGRRARGACASSPARGVAGPEAGIACADHPASRSRDSRRAAAPPARLRAGRDRASALAQLPAARACCARCACSSSRRPASIPGEWAAAFTTMFSGCPSAPRPFHAEARAHGRLVGRRAAAHAAR